MSDPMMESLEGVLCSMGKFQNIFEGRIQELRSQCRDEKTLTELSKGSMAMKDAAGIYLSWARHYMEQLNKIDEPVLDEMSEG